MPRIVVLLLLLLAGGCAAEDDGSGGLTDTFLRMREAGYDWSSVEHRQPAKDGHEIRVEVRTSTEPAEQAAKLVWTNPPGAARPREVVAALSRGRPRRTPASGRGP